MLEHLKRRSLISFAAAIACGVPPKPCVAQMTGPHAINLDPIHTTQPICDSKQNDGLDIDTPTGSPVLAPASGVISAVWNDKTYGCGLTVMIQHSDASYEGFAWLSDSMVPVGTDIKQGQLIAHTGQSGNASKPKLHWTLFTSEGLKIDPRSTRMAPRSQKRFTDPADLQKALDAVDALNESDHFKKQVKAQLIDTFYKERALGEAEYIDNLKMATDAWYANGKNWRKIPTDIWAKLREADRGRLKSGIDPEMRLPDSPRHQPTKTP